jgi:hypothetical protein
MSRGHPQRGVAFTAMSSVRAELELRHGRRIDQAIVSLARPLPALAKVFLFVAFVSLGAEAAPLSEVSEFEESGAQRQTNRMERSMTRTRLRRYFRHGMLPQLIAFEACIRHGSVTRAAEELSLAQPTVSCLVRKLSETLGGPVTQMRDRRVEPSALGVELLGLCQEVFASFERFDVRREGAPVQGAPPVVPVPEEEGAGYDPSAQSPEDTTWQYPLQQRSRLRSRQRASRCPRVKPRHTETSGES